MWNLISSNKICALKKTTEVIDINFTPFQPFLIPHFRINKDISTISKLSDPQSIVTSLGKPKNHSRKTSSSKKTETCRFLKTTRFCLTK